MGLEDLGADFRAGQDRGSQEDCRRDDAISQGPVVQAPEASARVLASSEEEGEPLQGSHKGAVRQCSSVGSAPGECGECRERKKE